MQVLVDASFVLIIWGMQQLVDRPDVPVFQPYVFPRMEVMSIEGHLEGVIYSMNLLLDWLGKVSSTRYVTPIIGNKQTEGWDRRWAPT